jgi:hypothetical protein
MKRMKFPGSARTWERRMRKYGSDYGYMPGPVPTYYRQRLAQQQSRQRASSNDGSLDVVFGWIVLIVLGLICDGVASLFK